MGIGVGFRWDKGSGIKVGRKGEGGGIEVGGEGVG